ncbi:MAG: restriction endonuclease subunit S [Methylococcales bacterium]|nr:restriction endonuclease subunit S [Methylococcales bacterium]
MNKEYKKLMPKFRFKEFSGEWEVKILDDCVQVMQSGLSRLLNDSDVGIPVIRSNNLVEENLDVSELKYWYEIDNQGANIENYFLNEGDLLVNFINSQAQIGKVALYKNLLKRNVIFTTNLLRLTFNHFVNHQFIFYFFQTKEYVKYIQEIAKPAVNQSSFTTKEFKRLVVTLPKLEEQTKIAACLSSLDDLITAQTQKIAALKTHKKGLMQQLFPQEGETVPKLRFSEFRDSGEWEEKKLRQLGELVSGLTYSPDDVRDNGLLVLRSSNVQNGEIRLEDNVYVNPDIKGANLSKPNDILICVRNGSKALIGKNALIPEGMPLSTHGAFMTVFRTPSAKFVFQLFQTSTYQSQVDGDLGATINSINGSNFIKYKFYVPSPAEQQKIAACLSSLDELINAQTKKLNALKLHKKGLMQGLFPLNE